MNRKKIVLIGPVYPYKGGISHYTGLMYRELVKKHDVTLVSYKMQYPKILFKKEQRDYSNDTFKIEETNYWINTANPFNIIHYAQKIKKMMPDLVIFQWWHPYFAPCYWIMKKVLKNIKVVYICHNVFPHERFPFDRRLTKLALSKAYGYVVQSKMDGEDLREIQNNPNYIFTPHPTYDTFKMSNIDKVAARELLTIENSKKVLLFFGFVREYKGLKHLLNALPQIASQIKDIQLLVVGDFGEDRENYMELIKQLKIGKYVQIVEGYVPDDEVEKYFVAADLVVLPYESATQSGIVQIAYGFEKPVVVTSVGGLPDVVKDKKTGMVVEPKKPEAIAEAVVQFFTHEEADQYVNNIKKEAYRFSWQRMGEVLEEFLK